MSSRAVRQARHSQNAWVDPFNVSSSSCQAVVFDKLDTAKIHGLDAYTYNVPSSSCRAVLFDKLDTANLRGLDTLNVLGRVKM